MIFCDNSEVNVKTEPAEYVKMRLDSVLVRIMPAVGRGVSLRPVLVLLRSTLEVIQQQSHKCLNY